MTDGLTTVVAVDAEHLAELWEVWPTWQRWHPEIIGGKLDVLADLPIPLQDFELFNGATWRCLPVARGGTQRDKMLSALLFDAPRLVTTPHWLKIDTDAIATGPGPPLTDFVDGVDSIASNPWGYSTPRESLERLEAWYTAATGEPPQWTYHEVPQGVTRRAFAKQLGPNAVLYTPHEHRRAQERAWHPRIIGWISIINTAFSRRVAEFLIAHPPPFISHDTLLWYLAERWGTPVQRIKFGRLGWDHRLGLRSIKERVSQVMALNDPYGIEALASQAREYAPAIASQAEAASRIALVPPPPNPKTFDPVLPFASVQPSPAVEPPPLVVTIPSNGTAPPFPWKIRANPAPVLYELLTSHFGSNGIRGAEIGVHQAATSHYLLQHIPGLFLYMVDPWKEYVDKSVLDGDKVSGASQALMDDAYRVAIERTALYATRRHILRDTSVDSAKRIMDNVLDFVFIDAAHGYESFCEDFRTWWPKVRSGGLLTGHDLGHRRFKGIRRGLDEMCSAMGLKYDVCPNTVWRLVKP